MKLPRNKFYLFLLAVCFALPVYAASHQTPLENTKEWLSTDSALHVSGGVDPLTPKEKEFNIATRQQNAVDQLQSKYGLADMWLNFKVDLE